MNLVNLLAVFLGAGLGGSARYVFGILLNQPAWLPFALSTLLVNLTGAFLAGLLFGSVGSLYLKSHTIGLFVMTGFLGGLTTFSAFTLENAVLIVERPSVALFQILSHVLGCLVAFGAGYKLVTLIH